MLFIIEILWCFFLILGKQSIFLIFLIGFKRLLSSKNFFSHYLSMMTILSLMLENRKVLSKIFHFQSCLYFPLFWYTRVKGVYNRHKKNYLFVLKLFIEKVSFQDSDWLILQCIRCALPWLLLIYPFFISYIFQIHSHQVLNNDSKILIADILKSL